MKKQISPPVIVAVIVLAVIVLGGIFYRQSVYAAPTPRPNRGVNTGGQTTSGPTNPGR